MADTKSAIDPETDPVPITRIRIFLYILGMEQNMAERFAAVRIFIKMKCIMDPVGSGSDLFGSKITEGGRIFYWHG